MAVPLSINNPQEQNPIAAISPALSGGNVSYAGNALGSGASTTSLGVSNILIYGAIALLVVWALQRID